jgi:hypothetical protein
MDQNAEKNIQERKTKSFGHQIQFRGCAFKIKKSKVKSKKLSLQIETAF